MLKNISLCQLDYSSLRWSWRKITPSRCIAREGDGLVNASGACMDRLLQAGQHARLRSRNPTKVASWVCTY